MVRAGHPRSRSSIVKTERKVHTHRHSTPHALHHPYNVGVLIPQRHEIDETNLTPCRLECSLQNQRIISIASANLFNRPRWRNLPVTVISRTQQTCEACIRRKCRPAQPVDRALARHQRGGLAVANLAVVFNTKAAPRGTNLLTRFLFCFLALRLSISSLLHSHPLFQQPLDGNFASVYIDNREIGVYRYRL